METREPAPNAIIRKRQEVAAKRPGYEQALASLDVKDMYEILSRVSDAAMRYNQASDPHVAAYTLGKIQAYLDVWHDQHRTIEDFNRARNELEKMERNRYAS